MLNIQNSAFFCQKCNFSYAVNSLSSTGVGAELSKIIGKWITKPKGCDCNIYARTLNEWGPDKCEEKIEEIVDKLMKQDEKLPMHLKLFPDLIKRATLKTMIKKAIKNARDKKT
tara:strand:- start:595 stop:936 length:342 start_codon:yes stop_codon:yes gene_type:complete